MPHEILFLRRRDGRREVVAHEAAEGESLLEAARAAGLPVAQGCGRNALCTRCALEIVAGAASLSPEEERERRIKARSRVPAQWRLACQALVRGPLTVTARYW